MSEQVNLNAETRDVEGKSSSRQLRRAGSVPAVIYGGKEDPVRISILEKDIAKASEIPGFATQILNISISGKDQSVIVKEIQRHPATQRVLHADLMRVNPDTKISISVPVRFINEDKSLKLDETLNNSINANIIKNKISNISNIVIHWSFWMCFCR